ncbi:14740_t:CDS:2, partial [Cetraspora pellucida]
TFLIYESNTIAFDTINKSRKLVTKCLNKISGQVELTNYETSDEESDTDDNEQNNKNNTTESFIISSSDDKLAAINIHIDYQFSGLSLHNICLYDYAATVRKTLINSYELSMLLSQCTREGNAIVDCFYFQGSNDHNQSYLTNDVHPESKSYIQIHCKHESERIVILYGKRIPKKDDSENKEYYGLCILMCSEETVLDQKIRQNAKSSPSLAKVCQIDCSVPGYDA